MPPESDGANPSLALGTHEAAGQRADDPTRVDSPQARARPAPSRPPTMPPTPSLEDPEGRIGAVLGNYRVVELLGRGGMGCVYRAEHTKLGREVALKMLRSDYANRKDAVSRFTQEARTVNRVRHRNIVDVPDILELPDGTMCIVMEFLRGQSLGKWARGAIDLPRALAMLVQICDGLAAAHAVGVVHRDLKPDNVFVVPTDDGAELVKLLDFGVAKLLNREDEDVGFQTAAGSVIGTPAYMSPEQAGGMPVDARSDIYSLGAIMYELFCGQPMFRGRSFGEFVRKHLTELPIPPRRTEHGALLDERLEAVILKAIEKEPARRFATVIEMRDAMLHLLGGLETYPPGRAAIERELLPATAPAPNALPTLPPALPGPPSTPGVPLAALAYPHGHSQVFALPPVATPWWIWVIGGAVVVSLGIGAAVLASGRGDEPTASTEEFLAPPAPATPAPDPAPRPPPEVAALPPPTVQAPTRQLELRFDSLPRGSVYAEGRSTALCTTPCSFNVDLADGEPTDRRAFIVRSDGYRDARVDVDLTAPERMYTVTLEQIVQAAPPTSTKPERPRGKKPRRTQASPAPAAREPDAPPATKKPGGKIDRSTTRDPFKSDR